MGYEVTNFSEILNVPGVWFELCFDDEIGVWDINGAKYFVTQNKKVIDANTGKLIDDNMIKEIDLENKKSNKYAWDCCYTLN